jgi:hypothetical protein
MDCHNQVMCISMEDEQTSQNICLKQHRTTKSTDEWMDLSGRLGRTTVGLFNRVSHTTAAWDTACSELCVTVIRVLYAIFSKCPR